jgi:starvation-inducible DNA-binding protein
MKSDIGLAGQHRDAVARMLNKLLADEHVLYIKLRHYHWNVVGPHFQPLHEAFEEQYTALAVTIDEIAERVRQLGQLATGTMGQFIEDSRLKEDADRPDSDTMIANLVKDHEAIIRQVREDIDKTVEDHKDEGTGDMLIALMQQHEKFAWMLRAHLEKT